MALEGLRTVEIYRMSVSDINWDMKTIYIHGKYHNDFIYPRQDVFDALKDYLEVRPFFLESVDKFGEPVFTSVSNFSKGKRLDRRGIRYNIDKWLNKAGYKKAGISCHMLRHTCATLLYSANNGDLRMIQQVLRHKYINITDQYVHIDNDIIDNNCTSIINLKKD